MTNWTALDFAISCRANPNHFGKPSFSVHNVTKYQSTLSVGFVKISMAQQNNPEAENIEGLK
jgi:hypothetical protein